MLSTDGLRVEDRMKYPGIERWSFIFPAALLSAKPKYYIHNIKRKNKPILCSTFIKLGTFLKICNPHSCFRNTEHNKRHKTRLSVDFSTISCGKKISHFLQNLHFQILPSFLSIKRFGIVWTSDNDARNMQIRLN